MNKFDVIVVGSGITGLTAALMASKNGKTCLLLEEQPYLGGSIRGYFYSGNYYPFGLSLLGSLNQGELLDRFFRYLGIQTEINLLPFPEDEIFSLFFKGERISLPGNFQKFQDLMINKFPEEKEALLQFFDKLKKVGQSNFLYHLKDTEKDFLDLFLDTEDTLWNRLENFKNFEIKKFLLSFLMLFGVFPKDSPYFIYGLILISYLSGTGYIEGGGIQLVKAFEKRMKESGVVIKTSEALIQVQCEEKRVVQVITPKSSYTADHIIFTGEPRRLLDVVNPEDLNRRFIKKLSGYEMGISVFASYFELKDPTRLPKEDSYRNFMCLDGKATPLSLDDYHQISFEEMTEYLSFFTNQDNGKTQVYAVVPTRWEDFQDLPSESYAEKKLHYQNLIQKKLEGTHPAFKENLLPKLSYTPKTIEEYLKYGQGGIFGLYASVSQKGLNSILPYTPIKNLYLAGQNIFLPGVAGCMASCLLLMGKLLGNEIFDQMRESC